MNKTHKPAQPDMSRLAVAQFEESPFPSIITQVSDGIIVHANRVAIDFLRTGYGLDDPIGVSLFDIGYHVSKDKRAGLIELARKPGGLLRRNDIDTGHNTSVRLMSTKVFDLDGVEYIVAVLVDISEVVQTELALADALERLEKAQSIAQIGDFVSPISSKEFNGSAEAMRILGFEPVAQTISTKKLFAHFHPDERRQIEAAMSEQLPDGAFAIEHRLHPDIDGERWVFTQATVETLNDGGSIMRGTVQDITKRKREETELRRFHDKMQETQKLESLGLLAGGIAHDFNNLLAGIMGNADFARLGDNVSAETDARLLDIVAASRRASDLTRQLLAYSGKGRFVIEPVDLTSLVREMAELLTVSVSREHALRLFLVDDLPAVDVDATQIRQIIMNLIINAGEAIDHSHGIISVATGFKTCDTEYLTASELSSDIEPGEYAYVEVSDNGVGMDAATLERIFDPFFTTKFTGRGLGLAAALGIARGHSGAIKIYSELGRGTTFKVFLPVSVQAATITQKVPQTGIDFAGAGVVLVVDDDRTVRDFVENVLQRYGYEVLLATDGDKGLQLFRHNAERIRLVLLDLTMPNMDGRETYERMRAIRPDVATVLMSGYNEQDATQEFVGKGLAGFLAKPFLVAELIEIVSAEIGDVDD